VLKLILAPLNYILSIDANEQVVGIGIEGKKSIPSVTDAVKTAKPFDPPQA